MEQLKPETVLSQELCSVYIATVGIDIPTANGLFNHGELDDMCPLS